MSSLLIHLPSKLKIVEEQDHAGTYEIEGLFPGYGHTLGNSLRRIILSSLPGTAVTGVRIKNAAHEFATLADIREDVIGIILNVKKIRFATTSPDPVTITLKVKGQKVVTAADIEEAGNIEVLNKDQYIAEITGKTGELEIEFTLQRGMGYVSKEIISKDKAPVGTIMLDALFSPIRRVAYEVEDMRVLNRTDYNRLQIKIETDGSVKPKDVLVEALNIMLEQIHTILDLTYDAKVYAKKEEIEIEQAIEEDLIELPKSKGMKEISAEDLAEILKTRVENLGFSTRTLNALSEANIRTLGGLVRKSNEDLVNVPGLGPKSIEEIKATLISYGLELKQ